MTRDEMDDIKRRAAAEAAKGGRLLRDVAREFGISMPTLLTARRKYASQTLPKSKEERAMIKAATRKRQPRYPWDEWLTQPKTVLRRGRDYLCTTIGMAQQVRTKAFREGLTGQISVHTTQETVTIELRAK